MNKKPGLIVRNLSAITLIAVYLIMVIIHLISDSFILSDQVDLLFIMIPIILVGFALDFVLRRSMQKDLWLKIFVQLMPLGIFIMYLITSIFLYLGTNSLELFNYLIWLFIALPFFITSYSKEGLRPKILHTLIGTGAIAVIYLFLTSQTDVINKNYGAMIYMLTYFFMLFTASGIKKLPLLGTVLGVLSAILLLGFRYFPITQEAKLIGWDYDLIGKIELMIIVTLVICILIRIYEAVKTKEQKAE